MRALVVASGLVAVAVLLLPAPSTPASPPLRELAIVRGSPTTSEIYVVREDGSALRRLTRNRASDYAPAWSPDGRRILFVSDRDGDDELYVMNARGGDVRRLTMNRAQDTTPRWSPDGRWIAFSSDRARPGEPEIWVMRADGGGARRLVATANHTWRDAQFSPTWSPDGKRVLFSMSAAESNPELFVVGVNGRSLRRLTRTAGSVDVFGDDTMPEWARDGKQVLFVSNREGESSDLWTMRSDGTGQRPLVRDRRTDEWSPRLSPDGNAIAFAAYAVATAGPPEVRVIDRSGENVRRVTLGVEPDWRPAVPEAGS